MIEARSDCQCEVWVRCVAGLMEAKHHRRVKGIGGSRMPETQAASNGISVCNACHRFIHEHPVWATENGFLVSQWRMPVEMPVLWRCDQWRLLDDFGGLNAATARKAV